MRCMMMKEMKSMCWNVKYFNYNAKQVEDYNVVAYMKDRIKELKKKYKTKEEFSEYFNTSMMSKYWSRCEWELIIEIENDRVILYPWVGMTNPKNVAIDVTDDNNFDWKIFAEQHIKKQIYKNKAKIDVYDQLKFRWNDFITYVWEYR